MLDGRDAKQRRQTRAQVIVRTQSSELFGHSATFLEAWADSTEVGTLDREAAPPLGEVVRSPSQRFVAQSGGNAVDTSAEGGTVMRVTGAAASGSVRSHESLPLSSPVLFVL